MLFDTLNQLKRYQGLHPNLDIAIDYLMKNCFCDWAVGTYTIEKDKVFFFIQENHLNKTVNHEFEYHRRYLDIHFLLEGVERVQFGQLINEETTAYNEESDFGAVSCQRHTDFRLEGDSFIAFFPEEAHQPNQYAGHGDTVKKCVCKVLIE